jgi:aminopeptidase N
MEAASGVPLERFFERWIYGVDIPRLRFSTRERTTDAGGSVTLRFEQQGEAFDVPVTVTLVGTSGERKDVLVKVTDPVTEVTVPIDFKLRAVEVNDDNAALAEIDR